MQNRYHARTKFSMLTNLLTSKQLKVPLKLRVLNCYLFSLFGAWTPTDVLEKKIEVFEMRWLGCIGRISFKENKLNEEVLMELNTVRKLLKTLKQRKL